MDKIAYLSVLAPIVADYRSREYDFWLPYISGSPIVSDVVARDGTECCVEISAMWEEKPKSDILVMLSIDDGGWRAFMPVTESFIIKPDGLLADE